MSSDARPDDVIIQVPLCTRMEDTAWLARLVPYLAEVVFGPGVTCSVTAPGRTPRT